MGSTLIHAFAACVKFAGTLVMTAVKEPVRPGGMLSCFVALSAMDLLTKVISLAARWKLASISTPDFSPKTGTQSDPQKQKITDIVPALLVTWKVATR